MSATASLAVALPRLLVVFLTLEAATAQPPTAAPAAADPTCNFSPPAGCGCDGITIQQAGSPREQGGDGTTLINDPGSESSPEDVNTGIGGHTAARLTSTTV